MAAKKMLIGFIAEEICDDIELEALMLNSNTLIGAFLQNRGDPVRVELYAETVVPLYSDIDFKSHFRMKRSTFESFCCVLSDVLTSKIRSMTLEKKVLATLWLFGNQESFRSVADRFGISKGTLHLIVMTVSKAVSSLMSKFVVFPSTPHQLRETSEGFKGRCGMPGVVGAIDGTHIPIPGVTNEFRASYINRKGYPSIVLQVICNSSLQFTDVYSGWPGSVHDARVYRNSPVSEQISLLPQEYHVLGDSAYPLSSTLLVPYRDNGHLNNVEKKYNKCHSSTRVEVERAIGLLKCKFRRLKYLDMKMDMEIPVVISACCVIHNYIIQEENDVEFDGPATDEDDVGSNMTENIRPNPSAECKRREIAYSL